MKKIAVLTSGGDAPAMNSAIRAINRRCHTLGIELVGIVGGYKGLYEGQYRTLTLQETAGIHSLGGTILKSSRFVEFKQDEYVQKAIEKARVKGIEGIIVIGGDGSYRGAMALARLGMPCIALPGTIDNDIPGTQFTIGFNTALTTIVDSIDILRDTARSHGRCLILEVMGRYCSDLAIYGGMGGDVDAIITSKNHYRLERLSQSIKEAVEHDGEAIVVVSENLLDVFKLAVDLEKSTHIECRAMILSYLQRGGRPTANDRILASRCAIQAVDSLVEGKTSCCTCIHNEQIIMMDIEKALNENYHNLDIYEDDQKLR